ncbi:DNA polymerase subunit Cdc27 [Trichophaea hybrida]|nr:DNA polymerase subunit Cdc27 [Trichophaea hybrida]
MDDYVDFLLGEVLGESKIITYRFLSRSLKVHVNVAKEFASPPSLFCILCIDPSRMLYDFYTTQNAKKADSVHASYLLIGYRRIPAPPRPNNDDEDTVMEQSPFEATPKEGEEVKSIIVVSQDKLEESKKAFSRLCSVHIYSIQPAKLKDLHIISGACQEMLAQFASTEEPAAMEAVYGTITNQLAKTASYAPPTTAPKKPAEIKKETKKPASTPITAAAAMFAKKPKAEPKLKREESKPKEESPETEAEIKTEPTKEPTGKKATAAAAAAKKTQKDFFSNWNAANRKAKDKKADDSKPTSSTHSPAPEPTPVKMETDSEGEDDDDELVIPTQDVAEESRKRKAKQQELEAMMESEDEEDSQPPPSKKKASSPSPPPPPKKSESPEPPTRRRRAKRKVTKKVTSKDEEGYLVTKMETTWESYSEDEPEPPPKPKPTAAPPAKKAAKGKAPAQGNIMSFFQKK